MIRKKITIRAKAGVLIIVATLILAACGSGLDGTYSNGMLKVKFESGGKAYMSAAFMGIEGAESEVKYEIDGDKVIISTPQGNQVLRLQKDGTLTGAGEPLMKQN